MVYLDDAGAYVYLFTTELAVNCRLIGLGEYTTRLACLLDMLEPQSGLHNFISERLRPSREDRARGWPDEQESASSSPIPKLEVYSEGDSSVTKDEMLHFITDQVGVLRHKWEFRKGDPDFFPSVPHGHLNTRPLVKLDAYRGYTYDKAQAYKPLARENRDFIVGLWRDKKFQVFAYEALTHFATHNPAFDWWGQRRIRDPFRLPK